MRRLRIIDLNDGAQPQHNEMSTIHVVFNGEIYNFRELTQELSEQGHKFTTHSDTEVIVHGFEQWGLDCFSRLNGTFAIAIWDTCQQQLVLARDHLGVKPLYYSQSDSGLAFGSELKPLLSLLPHVPQIDELSADLFFRYQYVPAPRSILQGVKKLPPGHYLVAQNGAPHVQLHRYWSPTMLASRKRLGMTLEAAEDLVEESLEQAVSRQLVSDVPLGAFLSGGIDSSTVVAMMQRVSEKTTKTFAIGFHEKEVDESLYARQVAQYLSTEHHEWIVTADEALGLLPKLHQYYDEPFGDSSMLPTYLLSQLTKTRVTVSLSGDGGDELFGGYDRYSRLLRVRHWWSMPGVVRRLGLRVGEAVPRGPGRRLRSGADILRSPNLSGAYRNMVSVAQDSVLQGITRLGPAAAETNDEWPSRNFEDWSLQEAMMLTDLVTYLPDDILTKVDRASMAHSLEARVPMLDLRFVELVLSLPLDLRLHGGPKGLLKRVLRRHVPAELIERPKQGFGIPIDDWLRHEMSDSLTQHLGPDALAQDGLLKSDAVGQLLQEHQSGINHGYTLWTLYMFQMWYENFYLPMAGGRFVPPAMSNHNDIEKVLG
jgi:asparagine synthase (glutamine-hydrolysing)